MTLRELIALLIFVLSGCGAIEIVNKNVSDPEDSKYNAGIRAQFKDQDMAKAFSDPDGNLSSALNMKTSYLYLIKQQPFTHFIGIVRRKDNSQDYHSVKIARQNNDSTKDDIAQLYIRTANARGNSVRICRKDINREIEDLMGVRIRLNRGAQHSSEMDKALIELDANSEIVSALTRQIGFERDSINKSNVVFERSAIWVDSSIYSIKGILRNYRLDQLPIAGAPPSQLNTETVASPVNPQQ